MVDTSPPPGQAGAAREYRERGFTSGDGLRLYFRDYGDARATATPVLCLSGLTRNCKDFHDLATHLSVGRRVLCPDYRGRGRSGYDPDPRRYTAPIYLDDIRHLLAVANVHRVVVVGTSLGGILAMAMAAAMPTAVTGAVLNDIGPDVDVDGLGRIIAFFSDHRPLPDWPTAVRRLRDALPDLPAESDAQWLRIAQNTYHEDDDGRLRFDWDGALIEPFRRAVARNVDLWPLFRALRGVPVLVVRGALSDVLTAKTFRRMGKEMPGLTGLTVDAVGHAPSLTEPHVLEAIDVLLAELRNSHRR